MKPATLTKLTAIASILLATLLVLAPFHAFLTISGSNLTGGYSLWRLWPEIVLLILAPVIGWLIWKNRSVWQQLQQGWLLWAIICYVLLHVGLGLVALQKGQVNDYALIYAWIINLRLMAVFVAAWVLTLLAPWLRMYWKRLLPWPAVVVVAFGLLQATALPYDFLKHFGYGPATIAAYETVDEKLDYIRIQSTLRGANPLGAYLVIVVAALLVLARRAVTRTTWLFAGSLAATGFVLFSSYSRSAYIGAAIVVLAAVVLAVRSRKERLWLAGGLIVLAVVSAGIFATFRTNDHLENTLFHTNEDSQSAISSNEQRANAMRGALKDVVTEPFGRGPGTAGPASVHNSQPGRIAENYYMQIGQETGWLGLGLFVAILVMVAKRLWQRRSDPLARILLVSLAGISFINLVQHAWADDTLALVWWGFAGVAMAYEAGRRSDRPLTNRVRSKLRK